MADKEYTVIEILDVLRRQKAGDNISAIARSTGMDRKTVRKYIRVAEGKGLTAADTRYSGRSTAMTTTATAMPGTAFCCRTRRS
jgi:DNA-binding IclR family transcriptional regulator